MPKKISQNQLVEEEEILEEIDQKKESVPQKEMETLINQNNTLKQLQDLKDEPYFRLLLLSNLEKLNTIQTEHNQIQSEIKNYLAHILQTQKGIGQSLNNIGLELEHQKENEQI